MYIVLCVLDVRTELLLFRAWFNSHVVLHFQTDGLFTRERQLKFNRYRLLRLIYWCVDSTLILVPCKILIQQGKVHGNWVILRIYVLCFHELQPVCLCFQIPSALSALTASWTSAPLRSAAPSSLPALPPVPSEHSSVNFALAPDDMYFCLQWQLQVCLKASAHQWTPVKHLHISLVRTVVCEALWLEPFIYYRWPEPAGMWCFCLFVQFTSGFREEKWGQNYPMQEWMWLSCTKELPGMPCHKLSNGHIWASSLYRKRGVIGCFRADVSAHVIDQRGRRANLFCSDVPLGAESEILQFNFRHI